MSKNDGILGISVNHGRISLAIMRGGNIKQALWEEAPDNIVRGTEILSKSLFANFLAEKLKDNGIKCKKAAYVIADSDVFIKNLKVPKMTEEQLKYNIPFEFRDYIQGELKNYLFDFEIRDNTDEQQADTMELLAYAVPLNTIKDIRETLKMVGLQLVKALPETCVYEKLFSTLENEEEVKKERCILDIGRRGIRMMIFKNGMYKISHRIDVGEDEAIRAIADEYGVDMHLAVTYLRTNYQDCNQSASTINAFKDMSIEIMKGLNYYEMSDMSSRLNEVVICGTGAYTNELVDMIKKRLDKNVQTMDELFTKYNKEKEINVAYGAVGILLTDAQGVATEGNLVAAGQKKKMDIKLLIPASAAIIVAAALFGKFCVADRYTTLAKEQARQAELQNTLEEQMRFIAGSDDLVKEYAHYTWDGMTDEEKFRESRQKVAKIVDYISDQGMVVRSVSLSDVILTVNLTGSNLESISKLSASLYDQDIVESCAVESAETKSVEEGAGVDARVDIYLLTKDAEIEGEAAQ